MTFPDLITPWRAYKAGLYKQQPCNSNRASNLGSDCERELTYWRTIWQEAAPPSLDLQIIFGEGNKHEREILIELQRAGIRVIEQQTTLEWREYQITGHVDCVVVHDGAGIPVDIKTMSPNVFDMVFKRGSGVYVWDEVRDAFQRKPWLKKYLAQITLYCLMRNVDKGLFICLNKATGALAQVSVDLDYSYGEMLLRRAARINEHVRAGTLPDRIPFNESVCPRCAFYTLCLPDHVGKEPIAFLEDATVEALLDEREKAEAARKVFEDADERVKSYAKARPERMISIGRWTLEKKPHGKGTRVDISSIDEPARAPEESAA